MGLRRDLGAFQSVIFVKSHCLLEQQTTKLEIRRQGEMLLQNRGEIQHKAIRQEIFIEISFLTGVLAGMLSNSE